MLTKDGVFVINQIWQRYSKVLTLCSVSLLTFTEDDNKTLEELSCSAEFLRGVDDELIFFSALNIFLSISAFWGNTLILVALHKETLLHPPSKLLDRSLWSLCM